MIQSLFGCKGMPALCQRTHPETAKVIPQQQLGWTLLGHIMCTSPNHPSYIGRCSRCVEAHLLSSQGSSSFSDGRPKIMVPMGMRSRCLSLLVNSDISKSEAGVDPFYNIGWYTSCGSVKEEDHPFDEVDTNKCGPKQPPPVRSDSFGCGMPELVWSSLYHKDSASRPHCECVKCSVTNMYANLMSKKWEKDMKTVIQKSIKSGNPI
jgi:hypothetical protein